MMEGRAVSSSVWGVEIVGKVTAGGGVMDGASRVMFGVREICDGLMAG